MYDTFSWKMWFKISALIKPCWKKIKIGYFFADIRTSLWLLDLSSLNWSTITLLFCNTALTSAGWVQSTILSFLHCSLVLSSALSMAQRVWSKNDKYRWRWLKVIAMDLWVVWKFMTSNLRKWQRKLLRLEGNVIIGRFVLLSRDTDF